MRKFLDTVYLLQICPPDITQIIVLTYAETTNCTFIFKIITHVYLWLDSLSVIGYYFNLSSYSHSKHRYGNIGTGKGNYIIIFPYLPNLAMRSCKDCWNLDTNVDAWCFSLWTLHFDSFWLTCCPLTFWKRLETSFREDKERIKDTPH